MDNGWTQFRVELVYRHSIATSERPGSGQHGSEVDLNRDTDVAWNLAAVTALGPSAWELANGTCEVCGNASSTRPATPRGQWAGQR